jgi:two-component system, cell cycle response regulator CpdR
MQQSDVVPMATILLADDDSAMRDLARRALEGDGHRVIVAQDGAEALEQMLKALGSVELLVTDVDMPGLNGIELATQAIASAPQLRLVLMSGLTGSFTGIDALKPNLRQMLTKPFSLDTLRSTVKAALAS